MDSLASMNFQALAPSEWADQVLVLKSKMHRVVWMLPDTDAASAENKEKCEEAFRMVDKLAVAMDEHIGAIVQHIHEVEHEGEEPTTEDALASTQRLVAINGSEDHGSHCGDMRNKTDGHSQDWHQEHFRMFAEHGKRILSMPGGSKHREVNKSQEALHKGDHAAAQPFVDSMHRTHESRFSSGNQAGGRRRLSKFEMFLCNDQVRLVRVLPFG